jgi:serine/threonine protein kinase
METFPQIGGQLGRFKLEKKLGEGSTGTVFLAHDGLLRTKVALRVLNPNLTEGAAFERISREVLLARQISHPGISRIFDLHQEKDIFFVTMEYIEGATLDSVVAACKVIPALQAARLADEIAKALGAAHESNMVHGGLTMSNIVLREEGKVSVLDFGLSSTRDLAGTTGARAPAETIHYMAPEVLSGQPATVQSDIYSLGVILYRCVTGRYPFQGKHIIQITDAVLEGRAVSPCLFNPDVPPALEKVITMAMAVDLKTRYQTASGFRKWLAPVLPSGDSSGKSDEEALSHLLQADIDQGEQETPAERREIKTQLIQIRDATILLSDIIGITPYFESHGDIAGRKKIQKHNELLFPVIQRHHGAVIKTIGDAIMAHFESPDDGVEAAMEMQQVLDATSRSLVDADDKILIRIGLHSGRTIFEKQDAFGDAVNVASRICSKAGAGEILISSSTHDKLGRMRDFTRFHSKTSLKGKTDEYSLFIVGWKEPEEKQESRLEIGDEPTEEGSIRKVVAAMAAEAGTQPGSSDGPTVVTTMTGAPSHPTPSHPTPSHPTPSHPTRRPVQPTLPPTLIAEMPEKFKSAPPVVVDQPTELDQEPLVVRKRPLALIALGSGIAAGVAAVLVMLLLKSGGPDDRAVEPEKPAAPAKELAPSVEELKADFTGPRPKPPPVPAGEVVVVEPEPQPPPPAVEEALAAPADKLDKLAQTIRTTMQKNGIITGDSAKFDAEHRKMKKWQKQSNPSKALLFGKRALAMLRSIRVDKAFVQDKLLRFNRYFDNYAKRLRKKAALRQLDDLSQKVMAALEAGEYNMANKLLNRSFRIVKANR